MPEPTLIKRYNGPKKGRKERGKEGEREGGRRINLMFHVPA